jgi:hypothetical protein
MNIIHNHLILIKKYDCYTNYVIETNPKSISSLFIIHIHLIKNYKKN